MESSGNQMLGLHQYLNDLNNLSLDTGKVTLNELDNIRSKFALDRLDDYSKRKYIWKLIATSFFQEESFINPKNPLGLKETLQCLQSSNQLDKDCAWNAINVLYSPIMDEHHWGIVLDVMSNDFALLGDPNSTQVIKSNLIGCSLNSAFIPDSLINKLQEVYSLAMESISQPELCKSSLVFIGSIIPKYQAQLIGNDPHPFIDKILSFLKVQPIAVSSIISSLSETHAKDLNLYQGQLLEFYSYLSNIFINDTLGETGISNGWEISKFITCLIKLVNMKVFDAPSSYHNLLLKITESNLKSIENDKFQKVTLKDEKMLLGSIFINCYKLETQLGDKTVPTKLLLQLDQNSKSNGSIFMDNSFKVELIDTVSLSFNSRDTIQVDEIYKVLKFGKLFKKLLHTKNEEICESIQMLLLRFSEYPLDFNNSKIILVILFDKFIRVDQKSPTLKLILKVMNNLLNSGIVRYSILKLIKCWITLGTQGDDYWLLALELVKFSVSNSNSGIENGSSLSNIQLKTVDEETFKLREQIIDFVYLGILSIPDNKVNDHESFFLLSLSILKLNAKYWLIDDIGKQINAIIVKYPVSSNTIKKCILQTFVEYYPLVDSKYKYPIITLLNTLSSKDDSENTLIKSSKLCYNVLKGELRFLKFDQGILIDFNDIKIMYRVKIEDELALVTFNCISKDDSDDNMISLLISKDEESKWEILDQGVDRTSSPNKIKFDFKFKLNSFYGIQDEPMLNIETNKGHLSIRICMLMKMIQHGGQMTKQSFDQRWDQVYKSLGNSCYDSRIIVGIENANLESIQRILNRMGLGIVSVDDKGSTLAIGLIKFNSQSIGIMVKLSESGELEVLSTQVNISNFISSRLEMVICSE